MAYWSIEFVYSVIMCMSTMCSNMQLKHSNFNLWASHPMNSIKALLLLASGFIYLKPIKLLGDLGLLYDTQFLFLYIYICDWLYSCALSILPDHSSAFYIHFKYK